MSARPPHTKAALRERMRARREGLDPDWVGTASRSVVEHVHSLPELAGAGVVAAYLALPTEPDLAPLMDPLRDRGLQLCVPAYDREQARYRLCVLGGDDVTVGRLGVREPRHPRWADATTPDIWLVPGLAFDHTGRRLGQGGGHYDRMLQISTGIHAGIAFAFQLLEEIPGEAHDVGMHLVITEQGIHRPC